MEEEKYGYIYLTENLINGKKYIGQHRAQEFEPNRYLGSGKFLLKAIFKYGKENFKCSVLEWCYSEDQLNEREDYYISLHNAVESENYYNLIPGGGECCISLPLSLPVICLETHQIFKNTREAAQWVGTRSDCLGYNINHKIPKNGYHFLYKKEYDGLTKEEIEFILYDKDKKIVCLESGAIYNSIKEASLISNVDETDIASCVNHSRQDINTAGGYHWFRLCEYETLTPDKIENLLREKRNDRSKACKPVVCIETGQVFKSIKEAATALNIQESKVGNSLKGIRISNKDRFTFCTPIQYQNKEYPFKKDYRVKCLETGEIFSCVQEVKEKLNINISNNVAGAKRPLKGKHWYYLRDEQEFLKNLNDAQGTNKEKCNAS